MLFPFSGGEGTGWKSVVHHTPHKAPSPTHSVLTTPWQRHVPRSSNLFLLVCVCVCYSLFVATSFPTPPQPFSTLLLLLPFCAIFPRSCVFPLQCTPFCSFRSFVRCADDTHTSVQSGALSHTLAAGAIAREMYYLHGVYICV